MTTPLLSGLLRTDSPIDIAITKTSLMHPILIMLKLKSSFIINGFIVIVVSVEARRIVSEDV